MPATAMRKETCLKDSVLLNFNEGRLGKSEKSKIQAHINECEPCAVRSADIQYWGGFMEEHIEHSPEDIGAE